MSILEERKAAEVFFSVAPIHFQRSRISAISSNLGSKISSSPTGQHLPPYVFRIIVSFLPYGLSPERKTFMGKTKDSSNLSIQAIVPYQLEKKFNTASCSPSEWTERK